MIFRTPAEPLESRRLMAIDVTVAQTEFAGDPDLMAQHVSASGNGAGVSVIVYSDRDSATGLGNEIYISRSDASGTFAAAPAQVNVTSAGAQQNADVAMNVGGRHVVVWQSRDQDGDGWGIYARIYDAAGTAITGEILVNQTAGGDEVDPSVAIDGDGGFVVAWVAADANNGEVNFRRFDSAGLARDDEVEATGAAEDTYGAPTVAVAADGTFGIAWTRKLGSGSGDTDVQFAAYTPEGVAIAAPAVLHAALAGNQAEPTIAAAGGHFIVAWSDDSAGDATIVARAITATTAVPVAAEFQVSQDSDGDRSRPSVAGDAAGNFTIGWTRQQSGAFYSSVDLRSYDATLVATSNETALGDGSSVRTLFDLVQTGTGRFRDVSTIGESLGYGVPVGATLANVVALDGTGGADSVVAYDLNATTVRAQVNGSTQNFFRSAYAYLRSTLGDGNDSFDSSASAMPATVDGGAGDDRIFTGGGRDNINAGDGNDYVNTGAENDYISGGSGDDSIYAGDGADTLTSGAGRNRLYGGNGNDRLNGSNGRDFLYGEADSDRIYGGGGNDYLDGGGGTDRVWAGDGDDSLIGGSSIDRLYGEAGNDSFIGGPGNDYLFGGDGTDVDRVPDAGDVVDSIEVHGG